MVEGFILRPRGAGKERSGEMRVPCVMEVLFRPPGHAQIPHKYFLRICSILYHADKLFILFY